MPSKNRRMMLTLPPDLSAALDDYREATGLAPSSFVVELLVECIPAIQATAEAVRAVESNQAKAIGIMSHAMSSALHEGTEAQLELIEAKSKVRKTSKRAPRKAKAND